MNEELVQKLNEYIATNILKQPKRKLNADQSLINSGLIDSLSRMDLALYVEDTFNVRIEDTELGGDVFDTLEELDALITSRSK
jgi:acyl carrier protein